METFMAQTDELKRRGTPILLGVLAIWGLGVIAASKTGLYYSLPALLLASVIALGIAIPAIFYFLSKSFRAYIEAIGLPWLTSFHIWRIAAALTFFWYGAHKLLPDVFVQNAGWGDFIAGFLALAVTLLPKTSTRYLAFHLFGFADFVIAVGTGLTLFLLHDTRMTAIATLPMALIIFYGVGISGASHIMAFDLLRRASALHANSDSHHALAAQRASRPN
jgi:hypothetical protein